MSKLIYKFCLSVLFVSIFYSCKKDNIQNLPTSLQKIINETTNCTCNPYIQEYKWRNEIIYLYGCGGPACDCMPLYFDLNGNPIKLNTNYTLDSFYTESTLLEDVWKCEQ